MYAFGHGAPKDYAEAVRWFRKAAEQGNPHGQSGLGIMYAGGKGVAQDYAEAVRWFRKAAEQGDSQGQSNLGAMYSNGEGVARNYIEAYKWNSLAASQGDELARKNLQMEEMRMTPEQVAEAQRLAREFRPQNPSDSDKNATALQPTSSGAGVFITDDVYFISNCHVIKDAAQVRLATSAGLISARVVRMDTADDLALLKAEGRFA